MDLTLLRYFYTIAQEGSFLAASQKLNYAQSNLSTRIRHLEKHLGTELFIRSKNGVQLTEKGAVLYEYAGRILSLADEAENQLRDGQYAAHEIAVSSLESVAVTFLPEILAAFHEVCPDVNVCVQTRITDAGVRSVLEGSSDLAFVVGVNHQEGLRSIPLKKEKLVFAASEKGLPFEELLVRPLLVFPSGCSYRRVLEEILSDAGIAPIRLMEFPSLGAILASAETGTGVCLFPESAIRSFTAGRSLFLYAVPEKYRYAEIYMIYRKNSAANQTLKRFIDAVSQLKQETQK